MPLNLPDHLCVVGKRVDELTPPGLPNEVELAVDHPRRVGVVFGRDVRA